MWRTLVLLRGENQVNGPSLVLISISHQSLKAEYFPKKTLPAKKNILYCINGKSFHLIPESQEHRASRNNLFPTQHITNRAFRNYPCEGL